MTKLKRDICTFSFGLSYSISGNYVASGTLSRDYRTVSHTSGNIASESAKPRYVTSGPPNQ